MFQKHELKTLSDAVSEAWKKINFTKVNGLAVRLRATVCPERDYRAPSIAPEEWLGRRSPILASVSRRFTLSEMGVIVSSVDDMAGFLVSGISSRSRSGSARVTTFGLVANLATQMTFAAALHKITADST